MRELQQPFKLTISEGICRLEDAIGERIASGLNWQEGMQEVVDLANRPKELEPLILGGEMISVPIDSKSFSEKVVEMTHVLTDEFILSSGPCVLGQPEPKPLDFTKPMRVIGGDTVTFISHEGRGGYKHVGFIGEEDTLYEWDDEGRSYNRHADKDTRIENVPIIESKWINVSTNGADCTNYRSREDADTLAHRDRIACIKIVIDVEAVRGRFDE